MRPLVIGGNGFIGGAIARRLLDRGHSVRVTRRRTSNTIALRKLPVEQVVASLEDVDSLAAAMAGRDTVFFASARYPRHSLAGAEELEAARHGARNVVTAARASGLRRLVVTGSIATAGRDAPPPDSVYHALKFAIDEEIERGLEDGVPSVILKAGGCLGPGDIKAATGFLIVGLASGALRTYLDGPIAFIDVDDLAEAHVRVAELPEPRPSYVLGGHDVTIRRLLEEIADVLGCPLDAESLSSEAAAELAISQERKWVEEKGARPQLPRAFVDIVRYWTQNDSSASLAALGLELTELRTTIEHACAWYAQHGYIRSSKWNRSCKEKTSDASSTG